MIISPTSQVQELGLKTADGAVVFGQIYGMADQISVPLAAAGFTVYKSVPYGPLTEVIHSPVLTCAIQISLVIPWINKIPTPSLLRHYNGIATALIL